jgi:hypothetical protein
MRQILDRGVKGEECLALTKNPGKVKQGMCRNGLFYLIFSAYYEQVVEVFL